ncbi:MAG: hypothetical protein GW903_02140 [Alphaproteobacteria bacterium]|nr:hypothetical protein [Alphaproteobacteria bacterium]NCQ87771.1 hypothetical protein [Alphaproteobacteria bacterium]NCT05721.1 hypothetical protein [Alphaproteobacteria bacterium]
MSKNLILYVLTAALRDKVFISFALMAAVSVSLSIFLGSSAVLEKDQFSAVFAASGLRFASVLALILFVVFYVRRSFETRDVEYMLTKPVSRLGFVMSHTVAFIILCLFATILVSGSLYFMIPSVTEGVGSLSGYIFWCMSLLIELCIMTSVALFFALVLNSAVSASLITIAFYVLARLMGQILGIIEAVGQGGIYKLLEQVMLVISMFIPRLDLMGQSSWILYGLDENVNLAFILIQGAVFCFLIFAATMVDFVRKQF